MDMVTTAIITSRVRHGATIITGNLRTVSYEMSGSKHYEHLTKHINYRAKEATVKGRWLGCPHATSHCMLALSLTTVSGPPIDNLLVHDQFLVKSLQFFSQFFISDIAHLAMDFS